MSNTGLGLPGIIVFEGVAFGTTYLYRPETPVITEQSYEGNDPAPHLAQYETAIATATEQLTKIFERLASRGDESAKIFEAQMEILQDEEMDMMVRDAVTDDCMTPAAAVEMVYTQFAAILQQVEDPLIRARSADILDVKNRMIRALFGSVGADLSLLPEQTILVAHDLLPSDTAQLDPSHVAAIITETGNQTSHTAILSRSLGIPTILAVADAMNAIPSGVAAAVDALACDIFVQPDEATTSRLLEKQKAHQEKLALQNEYLLKSAVTTDGQQVQIGINIGGGDTDFSSCDFCGLFRTEFLFMDKQVLPNEEEQFRQYRKVIDCAQGKLITLRTLDIGGDKTVPCLPLPKEDNPFLGKRALRLCLAEPALFHTQLRAALRASAYGPMQIMFPMVGSLEDYRLAKEHVKTVMAELDSAGIAYDKQIPLGIMIEIPSIAMIAELAAAEVDFASIGTNDLCQYLCAADRLNPDVAGNYQSYGPAMFRCLHSICKAFNEAGKPVSICGELAGETKAIKLLVGLGFRKLSMTAASHAAAKATICNFSLRDAELLAEQALKCATQSEILELLENNN